MVDLLHPAVGLLRRMSGRYPAAWDQYADVIADRAELGDWPTYVYAPLAAAAAVVARGADRVPIERALDVGVLGALAAWRPTQGIYRYDPTLLDALWSTALDGQIPVEHLRHLPEWCVYLELPGRQFDGAEIVGAWAHIESDSHDRREELRLVVLGVDGGTIPIPIHLRGTTLEDALGLTLDEATAQAAIGAGRPIPAIPRGAAATLARAAAPIVSVLLYLCTTEAEVRDARGSDRRPVIPAVRRDKRGRPRVYGAQLETTWETGYRIGAALRRAQEAAEREPGGEETGRTVTPHVRRAHWHTVLSGPRDRERRRDLRWFPPIAVGLDDAPELAVVRPVR